MDQSSIQSKRDGIETRRVRTGEYDGGMRTRRKAKTERGSVRAVARATADVAARASEEMKIILATWSRVVG